MWNPATLTKLAVSECVLPGTGRVKPQCFEWNGGAPRQLDPLVQAGVIRMQKMGDKTCVLPGDSDTPLCFPRGVPRFNGVGPLLSQSGTIRTVNSLKQVCDLITVLPNAEPVGACRAGFTGGPNAKFNCEKVYHDPVKEVVFNCTYSTRYGCVPANRTVSSQQRTDTLHIARACQTMPPFVGAKQRVTPAGWRHLRSGGE